MDRIEEVMQHIDRADFLPASHRNVAKVDIPISIGFGQTNSQPSTVRHMLTWLDPHPGAKVLDVGSGTGWTSALLARLVGNTGHVYSVEIIPQLLEAAKRNCAKYRLSNITFHLATDTIGLPSHAPYDYILVSASARLLPPALMAQLAVGGKMVIPVKDTILVMNKLDDIAFDAVEHPGFAFVPLKEIPQR